MKKPAASLSTQITPLQKGHDSSEDSGWTTYLQDFCKQTSQLSHCSSFATSSLISDATSRYPGHSTAAAFPDMPPSTNLIVIKRMRNETKISHEEELLEDTASSPVHHSPKGDEFKGIDMCMKKMDGDHNSVSLLHEKCGNSYYHEPVDKRLNEIIFVGRGDYEFTSLKKRRLCLVPLSLLSNYID